MSFEEMLRFNEWYDKYERLLNMADRLAPHDPRCLIYIEEARELAMKGY